MTTHAKTEAEAFLKLQAKAEDAKPDSVLGGLKIKTDKHYWTATFYERAKSTALPRLTLELVAECERLRELILAADRVTKERFTLDGMCDCIDNNGRPYQSDWAAKIILALQEPPR